MCLIDVDSVALVRLVLRIGIPPTAFQLRRRATIATGSAREGTKDAPPPKEPVSRLTDAEPVVAELSGEVGTITA